MIKLFVSLRDKTDILKTANVIKLDLAITLVLMQLEFHYLPKEDKLWLYLTGTITKIDENAELAQL